jgi:DNA-binding transcriptional ArsR family regulator
MHDDVWRALSDPTRRSILDLIKDRPLSTGDLCERLPHLDRCTVMKHLEVLVRARLVIAERQGRSRLNHINSVVLHEIVERWVSGHTAKLAQTAFAFRRAAEDQNEETKNDERD